MTSKLSSKIHAFVENIGNFLEIGNRVTKVLAFDLD